MHWKYYNDCFKGYTATYGSYYTNSKEVIKVRDYSLIFQVGKEGDDYRKIVYVGKNIIVPEGVGQHKIVISKNGGRNHQFA